MQSRSTHLSTLRVDVLTGLDIDGIYRVSGNLAVIQKLRFKADHGDATPSAIKTQTCINAGDAFTQSNKQKNQERQLIKD